MGRFGEAWPLSASEMIDQQEELRRAKKALRIIADEATGPMRREKLEKKVSKELGISKEVVWFALGDLLLSDVFEMYSGPGAGDIVSYTYQGP